jgi:O-acetyl-ADP-ribose deacetylase (regulator of RNase III)
MRAQINEATIELVQGDITDEQVDAIVNAANPSLAGGGGVDGAIHRRGGPSIMAVISAAGKLPARHVIHAVGPVWSGSEEDAHLLSGAYRRSLELAVEHGCQSVAFPALSAGAYRCPLPEASRIALQTAIEFLEAHGKPKSVRFVLFGEAARQAFTATLKVLEASRPRREL